MADPASPTSADADETAPAPAPLPPELAHAKAALDRGDFRQARQLLTAVLAADPAPSPELAAATRGLLAVTENDPWAVRVGLIAAGVLALVIGAYIL
jgi:hypothetical protein